ncbi:uncharacterized protein Nmag_0266 [Natrialba magadii ATCC 43099]|uniref:DUF7975 domain-containing protein n=1 Tax=Natrialba magadii (strain ATCC 43099 / DSM 3394 / CCM 3739 / CIP 104546 / IAM 13178 / JCM 8861 / NBRC 102185 / NCIMB 2190 / MS3) TaxID=547559 RepID=D3SX38_NATMM|nr:hypothetical protein [Natrialba magadii]ADD03858.1 uncharacterized protein Nmag_0266 [Natrialba magadii ATCC 43099]ELY33517.1 hypothetical protein C500_01755 [Natrialba magadii ATCC 43099]
MTRFDAAEPAARRKLYVDAITAHRTRASGFVTFEADESVFDARTAESETALERDGADGAESECEGEGEDGSGVGSRNGERGGDGGSHDDGSTTETQAEHDLDPSLGIPWLQFGDGTINLDCTDDELDRLKQLLNDFPVFKIEEIARPENADGVNVHVSAKADPNRIGQFIDAVFQTVYGLPSSFRVWVVKL